MGRENECHVCCRNAIRVPFRQADRMATSEDGKRTVERMSGMREDCGCRDDVDALVNAVNTVDREPSDFVAGLQLQWIEIPIERPETHHRRETDQIHRAPPQ